MTMTSTQGTEADPTNTVSGSEQATLANKSASVRSDETTDESETSENDSLDNDGLSDSQKDDQDESESKQTKGGLDKRFKKLSRQRSEAQSEAQRAKLDAEYWKAKALEGSEKVEAKTQVTKIDDSKPDPNDFDTNADYIDALTDWKLDQKEKKVQELKAKETMQTEYQKKQATHQSRVDAYIKENPNYKEDLETFVEENGDYQFSPALSELIMESDLGTAILHKLASDIKELNRINALSPMAAAREFGKYEARLGKESDAINTDTIKTSKAPAPITPVGSKSAGMIAKSSSEPNISFAEFERRRRAEMKSKQK